MRGLPADGRLRLSDCATGYGPEIFAAACEAGAEGIVSQRADAPYRGRRTSAWRKVKCSRRREFVVGCVAPSRTDRPFASLLVGETGPGGLIYRGRVGTGFAAAGFAALTAAMTPRRTSPFVAVPNGVARGARWGRPDVVIEVAFAPPTRDAQIRHGAYLGLRADKAAAEVTPEIPEAPEDAGGADPVKVAGMSIASGDRLVLPSPGRTRHDVARHCERMGTRMVEIAGNRPLPLYRAPKGIGEDGFFQKHATKGVPAALSTVGIEEADGVTEEYLYATRTASVVSAA